MDTEIGNKIRDRRKSLKMSQTTLAQKSKVSRGSIARIENGKCQDVRVGTLTLIADALGTTVDYFFMT